MYVVYINLLYFLSIFFCLLTIKNLLSQKKTMCIVNVSNTEEQTKIHG